MRRLISPIAYRHLRFFSVMHIAGGVVAVFAGLICLAYSAYGWTAFFVTLGALNIAGGHWYGSMASERPPRT
jgi:hypothetical protein